MNTFLQRFGSLIKFVVSGFDRLRFRGDSCLLNNNRGVDSYLFSQQVRYVDFPGIVNSLPTRSAVKPREPLNFKACRCVI